MRKNKFFWFYLIFLSLFFGVLSFFKLSGSSVGILNSYIDKTGVDLSLIRYKPRPIRSDEWLVVTPFTLYQSTRNNLLPFSKDIGVFNNWLTSGIPYKNVWTIFHPNFLPFLIFSAETAFSVFWWMMPFLLLISSYLFFYKLTNNNLIAVTSGFILFFSPFNQWWSNSLSLYASYVLFCLYFLMLFFESNSFWKSLGLLILGLFFLLCLIFTLYPPYVVVLGWLILFFIIGYFLSKKFYLKNKILLLASGIIFLIFFLIGFFCQNKEVITSVSKTSYPGQRIYTGGDYNLRPYLSYFYNIQFLEDSKGVAFWQNQSEGSGFFILFPYLVIAALVLIVFQVKTKRVDYLFVALFVYLVLMNVWLFLPLGKFLSKISFMYLVPNNQYMNRAIIGIGLADLFFSIYYVFNLKIKKTTTYYIMSFVLILFSFLVSLYLGHYLSQQFPVFIQNKFKIIFISVIASALVFSVLMQKKVFYCFLLVFFSFFSTYKVNPIYKGFGQIYKGEFPELINSIRSRSDFDSSKRWVVYDSNIFGQLLISQGLPTLSTVYFHPQLGLWEKVDQDHKYMDIYNRFAHVYFERKTKDRSVFNLKQTDTFSVAIDPCDKKLDLLNVGYIVLMNPKTKDDNCLQLIDNYKTSKATFFFYKVK